jgi:DNA polymerase-4
MCANMWIVPPEATILHADLDAFYASVEQRDNPRLRGRPVIVGAGVVLAASYEAKACGVRTAMGGRQARQLCPQAIVVEPRMSAYSAASKAVFEVFEDTTPLVEGLSIDEAFLDVGGLHKISGTPVEIAIRLRAAVRERVGLPITVGVARTKFLAKVASGVAKPDGLLVVAPEEELAFLHPLPVEHALGRSRHTAADIDAVAAGLVDRVTRRMRTARRVGRTVTLRLRFDDFSRATRSHTLVRATAHTQTILDTVRRLLVTSWPMIERRGITLVGVAVGNLEDSRYVQLALPFDAQSGNELDMTVDAVRERFGTAAVTRGNLLGRDQGLTMPMLPD